MAAKADNIMILNMLRSYEKKWVSILSSGVLLTRVERLFSTKMEKQVETAKKN